MIAHEIVKLVRLLGSRKLLENPLSRVPGNGPSSPVSSCPVGCAKSQQDLRTVCIARWHRALWGCSLYTVHLQTSRLSETQQEPARVCAEVVSWWANCYYSEPCGRGEWIALRFLARNADQWRTPFQLTFLFDSDVRCRFGSFSEGKRSLLDRSLQPPAAFSQSTSHFDSATLLLPPPRPPISGDNTSLAFCF